jgi:uncharacterized protein (TIGR02271 family)
MGRKDDSLTEYREKEPMTPAKIKEHEPTAVKREMTERITEPGQTGTSPEEAAEIARKKGMAKGTAGAAETGSKYEQGAAGTYASRTNSGGKNRQSSENVRSDTEETTIPVMEEDLEVSKRESTKGEATITKEPITETKEVEVPVTHEEAVIERRPASDSTPASSEIPSRTEVNVPLKSEEVEVTKKPYVKEEVSVKKKPVTETQKVSEEVTSEQVNVEGELPILQQFSHSIKVEETAKGLRIHVNVYGNNEDETIESALRTYTKTVARFKESGHTMVPMNGGSV